MTTYILNVHVCKLYFIIWQKKMKVVYATQVLKQGINIKTTYSNLKNMKSHLLPVYLGT